MTYARVAQWWSISLPRRGSRVRVPSRAFLIPERFFRKSFRFFGLKRNKNKRKKCRNLNFFSQGMGVVLYEGKKGENG